MEIYEFAYICLIGFCSAFISSSVAIGSGIFLVPALALMFPTKIALAIGAPIVCMADLLALPFYWRQWASAKYIKRLIIALIPGLLLGVTLLPIISVTLFKVCLGIFGMSYALCMLFPKFFLATALRVVFQKISHTYTSKEVYFFGLLAGMANIFAHAGGLVWSVYLQKEIPDKRCLMGTLVIIFFIGDFLKTGAFVYIDLLSFKMIFYVLCTSPCFIIGSYFGNKFNRKMTGNTFKHFVLIIICIASFKLCF